MYRKQVPVKNVNPNQIFWLDGWSYQVVNKPTNQRIECKTTGISEKVLLLHPDEIVEIPNIRET